MVDFGSLRGQIAAYALALKFAAAGFAFRRMLATKIGVLWTTLADLYSN